MDIKTKEHETTNEELEDEDLKARKKNNIRLYKIYKVLSFDLLFYYAIIYLFLVRQKGLTPGQVLEFDAFFFFFRFLVQIPVTLLIRKFGKRNSTIFACFINVIHILLIIFAPNFEVLLLSQLLCAVGFTIKATCETDLLYDSIERGEKRGSIFAKIDGRAMSGHYYLEAISSILAGFLFVYNAYLPLVICFIVLLITAILSTKFEHVQPRIKNLTIKDEYKIIKRSFKDIFKSKRLVSLLLFNGLFIAMIKIFQNVRNPILLEINMPEQYFGIVFAIMGILAGITTKYQYKIHDRFRNKTLTVLGFPVAVTFLIIGLVFLLNINFSVGIPIIFICFVIQYAMRGPYLVLIKRYLNNFTNSEKRVKIATVNNLIENFIVSILMFGSSFILDALPLNTTLVLIGCFAVGLITLLLDYMRHTVGLKMEQYSKKDIL